MAAEIRDGAVLLDAMGTLVHLDDPVARLRAALREHAGLDVDLRTAGAALKAEIAFYRANLHTAVDGPSLDALRARCAAAMRPALPPGASDEALTVALLAGIRFAPYPEVPRALAALRAAGWALVVVSNWDVSLDEVLVETGLRERVDGVVTSVAVGSPKPARAAFDRGLELAGAAPGAAWHVGDDLDADVGGARAAGVRPVLVDRDGDGPAPRGGVPVVRALDELPRVVGRPRR
ncbi:MAG TPA: HAD family hydrolase [Solirubrobacteraceae bacterium]|nr:HAD family hydrolase [Solirubrobacteraceae bacterium]